MKKKAIKLILGVALGYVYAVSLIPQKTVMVNAEGEESVVTDAPSSQIAEASSFQENVENSASVSKSELGGEGEPVASDPSDTIPEEPTDDAWKQIQEYVKQLEEQIKQLSETKFLNGTIGGLISSALTLLVYAIFKMADRKGLKARTELFSRANGLLDQVSGKVEELHKTETITEEQYKAATNAVATCSNLLNETNSTLNMKMEETDAKISEMKDEVTSRYNEAMNLLEAKTNEALSEFRDKTNETLEKVQSDYATLLEKYDKLVSMIMEMAKGTPDLIKSGTYSKIVEIDSKDQSKGE